MWVRGNDLADVCVVIIVLVVILVIIGIILKFISWGSGVAANIGTYRQGTAVKQIAQKGLTLDQRHTVSGQPAVCMYCGAPLAPGSPSCGTCGRSFGQPVQPVQQATGSTGPVCISCKKPFEGGEFCNWCGTKQRAKCDSCGTDNPAHAPFCRKCGNPLPHQAYRKLKEV
jgi:ribosomal protein L40E